MPISTTSLAPARRPARVPDFDLRAFKGTIPGHATFDVVLDDDDDAPERSEAAGVAGPQALQSVPLVLTREGDLWTARSPSGALLAESYLGPFEASRAAIQAVLMDASPVPSPAR